MIGTLKEIKELLGNQVIHDKDDSIMIENISTDSRNIQKNSIFIAIKGENFDGHDFIEKAIQLGAYGVVISKDHHNKKNISYSSLIEVDDTIEAYGKIARFYREKRKFKVVAITGSSGKTTTKDMIAQVLESKFNVVKTFKNNNNEIGLPYTILSATEDTEVLVLEMGMRALDEIKQLTEIADPDIGIITNIGVAHIGELGSRENIFQAKTELYQNMRNDGIAIINGEDDFFNQMLSTFSGEKRVFGFNEQATIKGEIIRESQDFTKLLIKRENQEYIVDLPFTGKHLILDALGAIEIGLIFNIDINDIIMSLSRLDVSPGRLEVKDFENYTIIDDTYNANPDSMRASLNILEKYNGFKIAVLGDMKELGPHEAELHKEVGEYCSQLMIDTIITVGALGRYIGEGINSSTNNNDIKVYSVLSNLDAYDILKKVIQTDAVVLVKGSRAMGMEKIIELLEVDE